MTRLAHAWFKKPSFWKGKESLETILHEWFGVLFNDGNCSVALCFTLLSCPLEFLSILGNSHYILCDTCGSVIHSFIKEGKHMTISKVKHGFPSLVRYAQQKTRRKFKGKPSLRFKAKGRIGSSYTQKNGKHKVEVSRRLAKKNPTLCKAVIIHELVETLTHSHKRAALLENQYLKKHGTTYRKEAMKYRRAG